MTYRVAVIAYHVADTGNSRPYSVYHSFRSTESCSSVKVFYADFDHISKAHRTLDLPGFNAIPVPGYSKNFSLKRIFSYFVFNARLWLALNPRDFDFVYICVPPNLSILVGLIWKWTRGIHVAVDIVDLWPEAAPLRGLKKTVFRLLIEPPWRLVRKACLARADRVFAVNQRFLDCVGLTNGRDQVLYLAEGPGSNPIKVEVLTELPANISPFRQPVSPPFVISHAIRICYLGSINSLIDQEALLNILIGIRRVRAVHFAIVGGGEGAQILVAKLTEAKIDFEFHGISFDPALKRRILCTSHFGYNGFVKNTEVALSYKSIEYMAAGLPLISNLPGDTQAFIKDYGCGLQFSAEETGKLSEQLLALTDSQYQSMRQGATRLYNEKLRFETFAKSLIDGVETIFKY